MERLLSAQERSHSNFGPSGIKDRNHDENCIPLRIWGHYRRIAVRSRAGQLGEERFVYKGRYAYLVAHVAA